MSERSAAEDAADGPEPTQSKSRLKRPPTEERPTRVSVRASAFGPPRLSSRPPAEPASVEEPAPAEEPAAASPVSARAPEGALRLAARAPEGALRPPVGTASALATPEPVGQRPSGDELTRHERDPRVPMSNSQFATRLSRLNVPSPPSSAAKSRERSRRPLASIALFAGMLTLSAMPLLRYLQQSEEPLARKQQAGEPVSESSSQAAGAERVSAASAPVLASEPASTEEKQQTIMALVAEANRALELGDAPQAERLFGRVIALDEDNPRAAFGLSRIRLSQGNLSGAEGWIQLAILKRPRRAAYHLQYAEILERLGNHREAGEERRRAAAAQADK